MQRLHNSIETETDTLLNLFALHTISHPIIGLVTSTDTQSETVYLGSYGVQEDGDFILMGMPQLDFDSGLRFCVCLCSETRQTTYL